MASTTMKQRFLITNIGLLGAQAPGSSPGPGAPGANLPEGQGVMLTCTPTPLDPSQPTPAGVMPVTVPFLDPAAREFFTVGSVVEFAVTVVPAPASGS